MRKITLDRVQLGNSSNGDGTRPEYQGPIGSPVLSAVPSDWSDAMRAMSIVRRSLILLRVDPRVSCRVGARAVRENFIAFTISVNDASTRQCVPQHNAAAIGAPDYAD